MKVLKIRQRIVIPVRQKNTGAAPYTTSLLVKLAIQSAKTTWA